MSMFVYYSHVCSGAIMIRGGGAGFPAPPPAPPPSNGCWWGAPEKDDVKIADFVKESSE